MVVKNGEPTPRLKLLVPMAPYLDSRKHGPRGRLGKRQRGPFPAPDFAAFGACPPFANCLIGPSCNHPLANVLGAQVKSLQGTCIKKGRQ